MRTREHQCALCHKCGAGLPAFIQKLNEAFVAQMLNIDLLGGISFEKGCYTGRKSLRPCPLRGTGQTPNVSFSTAQAPRLSLERVLAGEQHAGDVVDAVATDRRK